MKEYLVNLLERMGSDVWLPAKEGEPVASGTHSVSFMAYREAETVNDLLLLPEIQTKLNKKNSRDVFRYLLFILAQLAKNTKDKTATELFIAQVKRKGLGNRDLATWASDAEQCKIVAAEPYMGALLDVKHWEVLSHALRYCTMMRSIIYLDKICEILDYECYGLCHPMYAIDALRSIKDEKAIPVLERAIKRHEGSKKKQDKEIVGFAATAIWIIRGELAEYMPYGDGRG